VYGLPERPLRLNNPIAEIVLLQRYNLGKEPDAERRLM
jgi:hypothetical protein